MAPPPGGVSHEAPGPTPEASATPAPAPTSIVVRPPEGIARGRFAAPPWAIGAGAAALLIAVVMFFVLRHRRAKAKKSYESVAPQSSRR